MLAKKAKARAKSVKEYKENDDDAETEDNL